MVGLGQAGARLQRAEDEVGAREADDLGVELELGGLERLGDDGADRDDGHALALAQAIAAGQHVGAALLALGALGRHAGERLVDRAASTGGSRPSCRPRGPARRARAGRTTRSPG